MTERLLIAKEASSVTILQERLQAEGIESIAIPPITTKTIAIQPGYRIPTKVSWIVFTSPQSVKVFHMILLKNNVIIDKQIKLAAIGKATADKVLVHFGRIEMSGDGNDGRTFGSELLKHIKNEDYILWPCAAKTAEGFEAILREAGVNMAAFPIYKTMARPCSIITAEVESGGPYTAIVYYSPSGVESLLEAVPALKTLPSVAIGNTTRQALINKGINTVIIPSDHSVGAMIDAIDQAFKLHSASIMDNK